MSFCEGLLSCNVRLQGALLGRSFFSFHKMGDAVSVTPFYSAPHAQHQVTGSTQTSLTGFALTSLVLQTGSAASLGSGLRVESLARAHPCTCTRSMCLMIGGLA